MLKKIVAILTLAICATAFTACSQSEAQTAAQPTTTVTSTQVTTANNKTTTAPSTTPTEKSTEKSTKTGTTKPTEVTTKVTKDDKGNEVVVEVIKNEDGEVIDTKPYTPNNNNNNTNSNNSSSKASNNNSSSKSNNNNNNNKNNNTNSSKTNNSSSKSGNSNSSSSKASNSNNNSSKATNNKTWHEAEYKYVNHPAETKKVWVVDQAAYSYEEPVYEYQWRTICGTCGADTTGDGGVHSKNHMLNGENSSYSSKQVQVQTGTKTITVDEKGHYETQVVKEAWTEKILVREAGYY